MVAIASNHADALKRPGRRSSKRVPLTDPAKNYQAMAKKSALVRAVPGARVANSTWAIAPLPSAS